MKKILLSCLACLVLTGAFAQSATHKWSVAGGFGAAFPTGKFGSKNANDNEAVYAKTGIGASVLLSRKITPAFDLMVLFAGQQHFVDNNAVTRDMMKPGGGDSVAYAYNGGKWQPGELLAGGTFRFPLAVSKKIFVTTRLMTGAMKATLPEIRTAWAGISSSGGRYAGYAVQGKTPLQWAFACLAGAGIKGFVTRDIFLQLNLDYLQSWPRFPGNYKNLRPRQGAGTPDPIFTNGPPSFTDSPPYRQSLNSVNLTGGIGISF